MAPISHGNMYASARQGIPVTTKLCVLFLGQGVSGVVQSLDVLHDYLGDLNKSELSIVTHTIVTNVDTTYSSNTLIIALDTHDKLAVLRYALENNIDIIHDSDGLFTKKERFKHRESFVITTTFTELTVQLESYLTGNGIVWRFDDPVWHINWIYKYAHKQGACATTFGLIATGQEKSYTPKQMELVRALANKTMHIEHAREQLYYYLQLKRRAFRAGNSNNDFNFELTYHLTNYSIYICSAMDILARLINDKYGLGCKRSGISLGKKDFRKKLARKRKTLATIFERKKFLEWADWMFVRRNHITHESNLYMTPIVMRKKDSLSDEEMERRVDAEFDWDVYESITPSADVPAMRAFVKQSLDLQLNYEEVVTDMMTLEREDSVTHETQGYVVFPLRAIDEDFNRLSDVLTRAVQNISRSRS